MSTSRQWCRTGWAIVVSVAAILAPQVAAAQSAPKPAGDVDVARIHYDRGLQLYAEANYDAALNELERAYELAPTYKLLYTLARIQRHQINYAAALTNFRRYLREGRDSLPDDRRKEVEREIEMLTPRCATIEVKANVPGAEITVDDAPACTGSDSGCVGSTPLPRPLVVNPGRRRITATKPGYATSVRSITVVGSEAVQVNFDLVTLATSDKTPQRDTKNIVPAIVAWSATAGLLGGAVVTGIVALNASSRLETRRNELPADTAAIGKAANQAKDFALASDILTGATVVAGVAAVYFTIRPPRTREVASPARFQPQEIRFGVGPLGGRLMGTF